MYHNVNLDNRIIEENCKVRLPKEYAQWSIEIRHMQCLHVYLHISSASIMLSIV